MPKLWLAGGWKHSFCPQLPDSIKQLLMPQSQPAREPFNVERDPSHGRDTLGRGSWEGSIFVFNATTPADNSGNKGQPWVKNELVQRFTTTKPPEHLRWRFLCEFPVWKQQISGTRFIMNDFLALSVSLPGFHGNKKPPVLG